MPKFPLLIGALSVAAVASSHPGRTDASGGHNDRKNGGYHYHNGGFSGRSGSSGGGSSSSYSPASYPQPSYSQPTYSSPSLARASAPVVRPTYTPRPTPVVRIATPTPAPDGYQTTVIKVVDGDTLRIQNGEKVRLIGVDTPETVDPRRPVQYFGKEASAFTKQLAEGKPVRLFFDWERKDKYGRLLAYVYLQDGTFLNAELIRRGYAQAYTRFPFKYLEEFRGYEREAREAKRGLWADTPETGAAQQASTISIEMQPAPTAGIRAVSAPGY